MQVSEPATAEMLKPLSAVYKNYIMKKYQNG